MATTEISQPKNLKPNAFEDTIVLFQIQKDFWGGEWFWVQIPVSQQIWLMTRCLNVVLSARFGTLKLNGEHCEHTVELINNRSFLFVILIELLF